MKKALLVVVLAAILATGTVFADHPSGLGIGVVGRFGFAGFGGGGAGLSLKIPSLPVYWGLNVGFGENHFAFGATGDYYMIDSPLAGPLHWFFGVGGFFDFFSYSESYKYSGGSLDYSFTRIYAGARVPIGISFQPIPLLEIFLDIAPSLGLEIYSGYDASYTISGTKYSFKEDGSMGFGYSIPAEIGLRLWF